MADNKSATEYKVTWKGWTALIFLCASFSNLLPRIPFGQPYLKAMDFSLLTGKFGAIAGSKDIFVGAGGIGAREGFMFTLTLIPTVMLALGFIQVCEALGALRAAEKVFRPLLKPILGVPGVAGLAFVSSFTSSDVGAVMTKSLVEDKMMSDDERTIFVAYQYAGSATVTNTFGTGGPLLAISVLPIGTIILLIWLVKMLGAIFVRMYVKYYRSKYPLEEGGAQ